MPEDTVPFNRATVLGDEFDNIPEATASRKVCDLSVTGAIAERLVRPPLHYDMGDASDRIIDATLRYFRT